MVYGDIPNVPRHFPPWDMIMIFSTKSRLNIMKNGSPANVMEALLLEECIISTLVAKHSDRTKIVEANIKFHPMWRKFKNSVIKSNVRSVDQSFSEWLLPIGHGELDKTNGLSEEMKAVPTFTYSIWCWYC